MVFKHIEALVHAFTNSDGRNNYDELVPAVALVELEHGLDVDVGLSGTCLHLDVKAEFAKVADEFGGLLDILRILNLLDVVQQL